MKKTFLLLTLFISIGILRAQPNFPAKLIKPFAIKWTQDQSEHTHPIDLNKINIFVFTSSNEDPGDKNSGIYKLYNDLNILLDSNCKDKSSRTNITPGQYQELANEINTYIVYVGNNYKTYKSYSRGALIKRDMYKRSTNIVYVDDISASSFKDFKIDGVTTCVAAVYDNEGRLFGQWDANTNELPFEKVYKPVPVTITGRLLSIVSGVKQPVDAVVTLVQLNPSKPIAKMNTTKNGDFSFQLPDGTKSYSLNIQPKSKDIDNIFLLNQKGEQLKKIIKSKNGFNYTLINADVVKLVPFSQEEEDPAFTAPIKINGKVLTEHNGIKSPLVNSTVSVINSSTNKIIGTAQTDKYGDFSLNVSKDISKYNLIIDAGKEDVDNIIITDQGGFEIVRIPKTGPNFNYKFIDHDMNYFTDIPEEDIRLKFNKQLSDNKAEVEIDLQINYGLNEYKLSKETEPVLNKVVSILNENPKMTLEVISHTDSQGDDNSNLTLSKNRSNSVINYLVTKGISAKRLKAIGKGETKIRNRCTNGVDCSDKEHEYNRRTEFHFIKH